MSTNKQYKKKNRNKKKARKIEEKKKKMTAKYCHIVVHVTNSPNNKLQIVLSWGGCNSLRLIFSMYFEYDFGSTL